MHPVPPCHGRSSRFVAPLLLALCLVAPVGAQPSPTAPSSATAKLLQRQQALEAQLKTNLEARIGAKVDSIVPMKMAQLYEIRVGEDIFYADATGDYLVIGNIVDTRTKENLTRARVEEIKQAGLPQFRYADLPLDAAVKIVRGTGKKEVAIFEDPNCSYCRKLEKSILDIGDVTVYVFLYPVLGPDSLAKSKQIWCAPNRAKAWTDWMQNAVPLAGDGTCATPLDKTLDLGKKLRVDGTPTLFFPNNKRVEGAIGAAELQKLLQAS